MILICWCESPFAVDGDAGDFEDAGEKRSEKK